MDAYLTVMGVISKIPGGEWFLWCLLVMETTQKSLFTDENPSVDLTINNIYIAAYISNFHISAPLMAHMYHIEAKVDNTSA